MAKYQQAELRVALRKGDGFVRIHTVKLRGDELYSLSHHEIAGGKTSYHDSGVRTHEVDLLNIREWQRGDGQRALRNTRLIRYVSGQGMGATISGRAERSIKRDTRFRKTLVLDGADDYDRYPWGLDLWAISQDYVDVIPEIVATRPWKSCPIVGSVSAEWTQPALLITVWRAKTATPYSVYKISPAVRGRVPFEFVPAHYEGTWLDWTVNGDRVKWHPGDPWPPDNPVGIPELPNTSPTPLSGLRAPPPR